MQAVSSKVDCDRKDSDMEDLKSNNEELVKLTEMAEEEQRRTKAAFEEELHRARKEHESKVSSVVAQ